MTVLNIKVCFVYGWYSLRNIKVYLDGIFFTNILAQGEYSLKIPKETKEIMFKMGSLHPFKSVVELLNNQTDNHIYIGISLNYKGLLSSLYYSLKTDYLRTKILTKDVFNDFEKKIYLKDKILLKNKKPAILSVIISLIIIIFSVVQQDNELSAISFFIGLCSLITSSVYFKDSYVEKNSYKARMISTILLFLLTILFFDDSVAFLRETIFLLSVFLTFIFFKNLRLNKLN